MTEKTVSFSASELKAVLDAAIAEALAAHDKARLMPKNTTVDGRTEQQLRIDVAVCWAFKKREDVMTYNLWLAKGLKVKAGEKPTKIKKFRLFHRSQSEFVGEPSKAEQQAEADAAVAAHTAAKSATVMQSIAAKLNAVATGSCLR